jgi:hypothetical protein
MLNRLFAGALGLALALPMAAGAAPADFGLAQGYAYRDLDIAVDLTREREGGNTFNPYIWLSSTPAQNALWDEVAVVATPETGVCSVSGSTSPSAMPEMQARAQAAKYLTTHLGDLEEELGSFLMMEGDDLRIENDIDTLLKVLSEEGAVTFVSAAEVRPDVAAAEFYVSYDGELFQSAYRIIYPNGVRCEEVISRY